MSWSFLCVIILNIFSYFTWSDPDPFFCPDLATTKNVDLNGSGSPNAGYYRLCNVHTCPSLLRVYMLHTLLFQCLAIPANLGVGTLCHPTACMEGRTNPSYHSPLMAMLRWGIIKYSKRRFSWPDNLSCLGSLVPSDRLLFCYYKVGGYFITPTAALIQISLYFSEYFCIFSQIFPLSMMKCYNNKILWLILSF